VATHTNRTNTASLGIILQIKHDPEIRPLAEKRDDVTSTSGKSPDTESNTELTDASNPLPACSNLGTVDRFPLDKTGTVFANTGDRNRPNGLAFQPTNVPEPASCTLFGLGLLGIVACHRLRRHPVATWVRCEHASL
jgi:hypothetical protein